MASSEDFKKLYELYQTEGVPNGVSIVDFCQRNGVVYIQFERWFKKRYSKNDTSFHKIRVVGADVELYRIQNECILARKTPKEIWKRRNAKDVDKIIKEYENFAVRAYEGVACCNSCDNEYTWELSSDILEKYRDYFVSHQ